MRIATVSGSSAALSRRGSHRVTMAGLSGVRASALVVTGGDACIIQRFEASPRFKGVGTAAYRKLEKTLEDAGIARVELAARPIEYDDEFGFLSPVDFWEKMGYTTKETIEEYGTEFNLMFKRLRPAKPRRTARKLLAKAALTSSAPGKDGRS